MTLEPINIAVIAPTGAGKTSLITTIIDHIRHNVDEKNFEIRTTNKEADKLKELKPDLKSVNMNFNSVMIPGTSVCSEYKFSIIYRNANNNIDIEQPFDIMDIPGGFINNPDSYKQKEEYQRFLAHLMKSRIIWIPIDAPVMMSPVTIDEVACSKYIRSVDNIQKLIKAWAIPAESNVDVSSYFLNFILLKCETYFSQDEKGVYSKCRRQFDENYDSVISYVKENSKKTSMACVAVETIGAIKVKTVDWDIDNKSVVVKYRTAGKEKKISGAECILNDTLIIAREMIEEKIKIIKLTKTHDKDRYEAELEDMISDLEQKKRENTETLQYLSKLYSDLSHNKSQYAVELDKSWLGRLFKGDYRGYYRNKIDEVQQLINRENATSKSLSDKIEFLKQSQSNKEQDIENVADEISGLEKLLEEFSKLGIRNKNTHYYRTL